MNFVRLIKHINFASSNMLSQVCLNYYERGERPGSVNLWQPFGAKLKKVPKPAGIKRNNNLIGTTWTEVQFFRKIKIQRLKRQP